MILFKEAEKLSRYIFQQKKEGKTISFVPTMGALHQGHLSLLAAAKKNADLAVCSIFVNPTQFNNPDDFNKYPITLEKDIEQLINNGGDILFLPSVKEIYPAGYQAPMYDLGRLETMLEGQYRPGHFQGVCQVVDRLLQIVEPDFLFLGQKDYQQCQVIQQLLVLTNRSSVSLIISPTVREDDGLAMSSRNLRLNELQRGKAPLLYMALQKAKDAIATENIAQIKAEAKQELTEKGFAVDYFEIADATTLLPATDTAGPVIGLVAAYLNDIRLIDNLPLTVQREDSLLKNNVSMQSLSLR
jgi:pantoate--beta-alanine ligase